MYGTCTTKTLSPWTSPQTTTGETYDVGDFSRVLNHDRAIDHANRIEAAGKLRSGPVFYIESIR